MGDESDILRHLAVFDNRYDGEIVRCLTMWAHVFKQGLADYTEALRYERRERRGRHTVLTDERDAVKTWFESDEIYPGSFAWLCELFDRGVPQTRAFVSAHWRTLHAAKERKGRTGAINVVEEKGEDSGQ